MINIWVWGSSGRMGQKVIQVAQEPEWSKRVQIAGQTDTKHSGELKKFDHGVVIDFSTPAANQKLLGEVKAWRGEKLSILIATTGLDQSQLKEWHSLCQNKPQIQVLEAPNTSPGVRVTRLLSRELAKLAKNLGYDFEIEESHHRNKVDRPSGTALSIAEEVTRQTGFNTQYPAPATKRQDQVIGMSVIRGGGITGEHKLRAIGLYDEINIQHRAFDRKVFALGALQLSEWLLTKDKEGAYYTLDDVD